MSEVHNGIPPDALLPVAELPGMHSWPAESLPLVRPHKPASLGKSYPTERDSLQCSPSPRTPLDDYRTLEPRLSLPAGPPVLSRSLRGLQCHPVRARAEEACQAHLLAKWRARRRWQNKLAGGYPAASRDSP